MPGRNDPCPCGSGKKYKKCCLKKDEETRRAALAEAKRAEREAAAAPLWPLTPPAKHLPAVVEADDMLSDEPEPEDEADFQADLAIFNARWEEFEAAEDCEGQIAIFQATMEDGLLDADFAFEMMDVIYQATAASGERDRFDALVALLRKRRPDIYAHDAHYHADWLISNALAAGHLDALPALADELANTAATISRLSPASSTSWLITANYRCSPQPCDVPGRWYGMRAAFSNGRSVISPNVR